MGRSNGLRPSRQTSRLLALPTELQTIIYEDVFIYPGALVVHGMLLSTSPRHAFLWDYVRPVHLAITQSCHFLRGFTSSKLSCRLSLSMPGHLHSTSLLAGFSSEKHGMYRLKFTSPKHAICLSRFSFSNGNGRCGSDPGLRARRTLFPGTRHRDRSAHSARALQCRNDMTRPQCS
jgi:hypothetical protein